MLKFEKQLKHTRMKTVVLTIALFCSLQVCAQTELIDTAKYVKLDDTLYKSTDGKTMVRFYQNSFTAQCTGKEIDKVYSWAAYNMNYVGELTDNEGRQIQVFENEKYIAQFYRHSTRTLTVIYK